MGRNRHRRSVAENADGRSLAEIRGEISCSGWRCLTDPHDNVKNNVGDDVIRNVILNVKLMGGSYGDIHGWRHQGRQR